MTGVESLADPRHHKGAEDRTRVVIVGAGLMGSQIAVEFALHGFRVDVLARRQAAAEERIRRTFSWALGLEIANRTAIDDGQLALAVTADIDALPVAADMILECLPEDLELKVRVIADVVRSVECPVIATNTASIPVTELGDGVSAPDRTLGLHYWNPPLLMPLVEVVPGARTLPRVVAAAHDILRQAGKVAVDVDRDVPGFIWNRLQFAVLREALWLLDNRVASVEAIDQVIQLGLARRWRHAGLFESIHLGGARNWETVAGNLFPVLSKADRAAGLASRIEAAAARWQDGRRRDTGLARDRWDGTPTSDSTKPEGQ